MSGRRAGRRGRFIHRRRPTARGRVCNPDRYARVTEGLSLPKRILTDLESAWRRRPGWCVSGPGPALGGSAPVPRRQQPAGVRVWVGISPSVWYVPDMRTLRLLVASALLLGFSGVSALGQSFTLFSRYPIYGLSRDGATAVGSDPSGRSFRWMLGSGPEVFGASSSFGSLNAAYAVSASGRYIAGWNSPNAGPTNAYLWSEQGGYRSLGNFAGADHSYPSGVSADGAVIVGTAEAAFGTLHRALIWTEAGGLRALSGVGPQSGTTGVSDDGRVVAGWRVVNDRTRAFTWDTQTGPHDLSSLFADGECEARGINNDGSIVVGASFGSGIHATATLWRDGQAASLGHLSGFWESRATGVSDDGTVIVGIAESLLGEVDSFVWTASGGMEHLRGFLERHGVVVPAELSFNYAPIVSGDGRTFSGIAGAQSPLGGGFVVTVPQPGTVICLTLGALIALRPRRSQLPGTSRG